MRYWFRKHRLAKFDAAEPKYGRRNRVGHSHQGRKAQDADYGAGVVSVELGT